MNTIQPCIDAATVKVMRSHDYCHFEVSLTTALPSTSRLVFDQDAAVDNLRKRAARLVDKAVTQYQDMKRCLAAKSAIEQKWLLAQAENTPEDERTPQQKAVIKYHADAAFAARFDYDYNDNWEEPV